MRAWLEARPQDLTPQERNFGQASIKQAGRGGTAKGEPAPHHHGCLDRRGSSFGLCHGGSIRSIEDC
jgi:hypothetical protein